MKHYVVLASLGIALATSGCAHFHPAAPVGVPAPAAASPATAPAPVAAPAARPTPEAPAPVVPTPAATAGSGTPAAAAAPAAPAPRQAAVQPPRPVAPAVAGAAPKPVAPTATRTSPVAAAAPAAASAPAAAPAASTAGARPAAAPTLDLAALEQRLRETRSIGVFTKLSLKNQVDDLLDQARAYYRSQGKPPPTPLRQRYEGLLMRVITLLQDGDPPLAAAIATSREAIWGILADPDKLSKI